MAREEREQAISEFNNFKKHSYNHGYLPSSWSIEMAIKALEQLTSYEQTINKLTEAISEQATILDNLLIIKYPYLLSEKEADYFYKRILSQKAKGLVILPAGCEAVYIPNDCEIVMETEGD